MPAAEKSEFLGGGLLQFLAKKPHKENFELYVRIR